MPRFLTPDEVEEISKSSEAIGDFFLIREKCIPMALFKLLLV